MYGDHCGSCRYYEHKPKAKNRGLCRWTMNVRKPMWLTVEGKVVDPREGSDCEAYSPAGISIVLPDRDVPVE